MKSGLSRGDLSGLKYMFHCINHKLSKDHRERRINNTKTRLYDFDPLKPHFYIVKLGFTGINIISFSFFFFFFFF